MAILLEGMKCNICNKPIEQNQEIISFQPFVSNKYDSIYEFSDAAFHKNCFHKHPLASEVETRLNEFRQKTGPGKRICEICNNKIKNPDDYLGLGHLTDDSQTSLSRYNYNHFHRSCLCDWDGLPKLYYLLNELQDSGKWGGEGLKRLLENIKKISIGERAKSD